MVDEGDLLDQEVLLLPKDPVRLGFVAQMMEAWGSRVPAIDRGGRETTVVLDGNGYRVVGFDGNLHPVGVGWAWAMVSLCQRLWAGEVMVHENQIDDDL